MLAALILIACLCAPVASAQGVQELPVNARLYLPVLTQEIDRYWLRVPMRSVLGAQIEQETCAHLASKKCWSPRTELKTDREYGFGLGQLTVTKKFNSFEEIKALDPTLKVWKWEDRYDPVLQLRALVLKDRYNFDRFPLASSSIERLALGIAAYNGGVGGTINDIKLCGATPGCDQRRWFGGVENTSLKSRTKWQGYGQSAFEINRGYVRNIFGVRRGKYITAMGDLDTDTVPTTVRTFTTAAQQDQLDHSYTLIAVSKYGESGNQPSTPYMLKWVAPTIPKPTYLKVK